MCVYCLPSTHSAAEVALNQSLGVQLGPEILAELHQLTAGQTSCQSLTLLHHGPARVLQDQQAHVPEKKRSEERGGGVREKETQRGGKEDESRRVSPPFRPVTQFTTRRHHRLEDESGSEMEMSEREREKKTRQVR